MGVLCYTKFEFNQEHKIVLNCFILYLPIIMITGFQFLKNLKNNKINL